MTTFGRYCDIPRAETLYVSGHCHSVSRGSTGCYLYLTSLAACRICHFTVGSRREVDGVTLFLDWQPARAKELLKDDILLLLTGESGQLVEDGSS